MVSETPGIQFATTSDGVRIAYTDTGDGPPLLCVPGWVSHLELDWYNTEARDFYGRLAHDRRLIRYDGRGTGLSDRNIGEISVQAHVEDLASVIDHLRLKRVALFAWSQRTPAAMVYAAEHPERVERLILYGSFCEGFIKREATLGRALLELIRAEWGVGARTTVGFVHPDADREEQQQSLHYLRESSEGEMAARILEEGMFNTDVTAYLPRIQAPALVLHRRNDNAVPPECGRRVASLLPKARFVQLEGDHHLPWDGDTEPLLRYAHEFLGVEAPPAPAPTPSTWAIDAILREATVTLLFTDMEGSTTLTDRLGDAQAQALVRSHNAIVRDAIRANGGSEIKHTGDGIMASFPSASGGLDCAVQIQRGLAQHNVEHPDAPIHVRIGLNAGEPVREEDDLFGTVVQTAARIADRAEPDQVLVSDVVRQLAAGKGFLFSDQGETVLRGFEDPVRLYEVRWGE